jgi:lysine 2,3-aminomutase
MHFASAAEADPDTPSLPADWMNVDWQEELKHNITDPEALKLHIALSPQEEADLKKVVGAHPMNIPRYYLSLIDRNDRNDPIRRMCVPEAEELIVAGDMGETTGDPYGDDKHDKGNGILHKYPYTALVVATEYCSMYCRHCFRKRMVGLPNDQTVQNFQAAAKYIAGHPEITNVVVSGGDPFLLPTDALIAMLNALRDIPHLNFVRIGSRAPVVFPMRFFDDELIDFLREFNKEKALFVPTHFNHPNEITPVAAKAVQRLHDAGITVNNQAVFLRGVNDNEDTLVELKNGLLRIGVSPYYLYQCMPVSRVRHHCQVPLRSTASSSSSSSTPVPATRASHRASWCASSPKPAAGSMICLRSTYNTRPVPHFPADTTKGRPDGRPFVVIRCKILSSGYPLCSSCSNPLQSRTSPAPAGSRVTFFVGPKNEPALR